MAVDAIMRKLNVPPKFVPYLEKHRIYELFHEVGNELAMTQPNDPLLFLKECLERFSKVRDKRIVLFLAPPYLDRIKLVQLVAAKTGYDILSRYIMCRKPGNHLDPNALAVNTSDYIGSLNREGWLLADFPDTLQEAKALIKCKIIPTHSFLLIDDGQNAEDNRNFLEIRTTRSILMECDNNIFRLRDIFKSSLKTVKIKDRSLEEVAGICVELIKQMPPRNAPKLFRVALIGPKGSRRKTVAKLLLKKYNLVHVDMHHLINAARFLENDKGDEIRHLERRGLPYSNKLILDLLKSRLFKRDCLERGYVLTNYPRSREDFVLLDSIETPPNKVIFFDIEDNECKERLADRVVNMHTGRLHSRKEIQSDRLLNNQALTHPDDEMCIVEEEIKFYNKHFTGLLEYCGHTGHIIDASGSVNALLERVECVLMTSTPTVNPRSGKLDKRRSSICCSSTQESGARNGYQYPISHTQVIPLIDSEELLNRFRELKRSAPETSKSDLSYRLSQIDGEENSKYHDYEAGETKSITMKLKDKAGYFTISKTVFNGDALAVGENVYCNCDELLILDEDNYCTCDEPLILDEQNYCTCDEPLIILDEENYCTCDEPLILDEDNYCTCAVSLIRESLKSFAPEEP